MNVCFIINYNNTYININMNKYNILNLDLKKKIENRNENSF